MARRCRVRRKGFFFYPARGNAVADLKSVRDLYALAWLGGADGGRGADGGSLTMKLADILHNESLVHHSAGFHRQSYSASFALTMLPYAPLPGLRRIAKTLAIGCLLTWMAFNVTARISAAHALPEGRGPLRSTR
jgi:hypothetical protein